MASLKEITPKVAQQAFVRLEFKPDALGSVRTSVTAGGFQGSATMTPMMIN